jgi:hypothetical protein
MRSDHMVSPECKRDKETVRRQRDTRNQMFGVKRPSSEVHDL